MQQQIHNAIEEALEELGLPDAPFVVERPGDLDHGDFATNAALVAAKQLKQNPRDVAVSLKSKLSLAGVEKIEIAGPGFLNFFLSSDAVSKEVSSLAEGSFNPLPSDMSGQTVMVEYTQPNPFKEFHIGHLMSNTTGEAIARTLQYAGAKVIRANYQGDVGPHVAKALYVLLQKDNPTPSVQEISAAYVEGARLYEENTATKSLIDQLNKKIYQQYGEVTDERLWKLYQHGRETTLEHFEELYRMLGTTFDFYFFESETALKGLALVLSHPDVFEASEGAVVFHGENYGLHTRVFVNSLGLPTYETKDLGLAEFKKERAQFDLSITETAKEQDEYFKVVFKALELVHPEWAGQFTHVSHGMMRFAQGKMSSRRGNVITGESLLMDLKDAAKEKMQGRTLKDVEKTASLVAVGAIKYAVLKQGRGKDIIFDPEKSLSLEGDSGPYLQYAHTRARSLLRMAQDAGIVAASPDVSAAGRQGDASTSDEASPETSHAPAEASPHGPAAEAGVREVSPLERALLHFEGAVARAVTELEPHHITTYLTELASLFNSWYASNRVIGGNDEAHGVLLTQAFANTMQKGLELLGIPVPEEM